MKELVQLIIDVLAVYRLTRLINEDYILKSFREKIWEKYPPSTSVGYLLTCNWCLSIWTALVLFLIRKTSQSFYKELSLLLAASAVTGIISEKL